MDFGPAQYMLFKAAQEVQIKGTDANGNYDIILTIFDAATGNPVTQTVKVNIYGLRQQQIQIQQAFAVAQQNLDAINTMIADVEAATQYAPTPAPTSAPTAE